VADVKVKFTSAWWFRETFYKPGSIVVVPEGTSVPQGFIVDGIEVPKREKVSVKEILELQELQEKDLRQQEEILKLKKQLAAATAPKSGPGVRVDKEKHHGD